MIKELFFSFLFNNFMDAAERQASKGKYSEANTIPVLCLVVGF